MAETKPKADITLVRRDGMYTFTVNGQTPPDTETHHWFPADLHSAVVIKDLEAGEQGVRFTAVYTHRDVERQKAFNFAWSA
ncbi:MAG: hypothetical protein PHY34_03150 [Patescibacteria group bacterium]|nr:hypothetical protein [Patescibacteria group bacterium]MDD5716127.1 hypothetical protein [Patescibacteria group bacterium]